MSRAVHAAGPPEKFLVVGYFGVKWSLPAKM